MEKNQKKLKIFFSAGEDSGDLLAASLYLKLKEKAPEMKAYGITGEMMKKSGIKTTASLSHFKVMGFVETLSKISFFKKLTQKLLQKLEQDPPDLAILVDNQEFNQNLGEQLKLRGIPSVLYVAPQVWAWRKKRALYLHEKFDLILGLLPFESDFFSSYPINYQFIGSDIYDRTRVYKENKIKNKGQKKLAFFPGSRLGELKHTLPFILQVIKNLNFHRFQIQVQVKEDFSYKEISQILEKEGASFKKDIIEIQADGKKTKIPITRKQAPLVMSTVDFAFVTSGTASLECALIGTPLCVFYKTSPLNYFLAKLFVKIPHISLPNIILKRRAFEEFIQNPNPKKVADFLSYVLTTPEKYDSLKKSLEELSFSFQEGASEKASQILLENYLSGENRKNFFK